MEYYDNKMNENTNLLRYYTRIDNIPWMYNL